MKIESRLTETPKEWKEVILSIIKCEGNNQLICILDNFPAKKPDDHTDIRIWVPVLNKLDSILFDIVQAKLNVNSTFEASTKDLIKSILNWTIILLDNSKYSLIYNSLEVDLTL